MRHNLSEVTELMRDRRSISPERFSSRKVHKEVVELLLTNATWAPTHGMTQPWRFAAYVGDGMSSIGPKLAEWYQLAAGENASEAKVAKLEARGKQVTAMVIVGVKPDPNGRIDIRDERNAVACAMQNMYLTCIMRSRHRIVSNRDPEFYMHGFSLLPVARNSQNGPPNGINRSQTASKWRMHAYIHACIHACMLTYIRTYIRRHIHALARARARVRTKLPMQDL